MKKQLGIWIGLLLFGEKLQACSDIFIEKGGYHIEARTLDFLVNVAFENKVKLVGEKNVAQIILNQDKIPSQQLARWTNKYGYLGRAAFDGRYILDGLNTQGLTVSMLYLEGTQYPVYNNKDKRPVIGIYDLLPYILSQAATTAQALRLLESVQIIQAVAQYDETTFIRDIPIHFVIRDKHGGSIVVEFINGKTKIYDHAGTVLTNAPSFDWQKENAKHYLSLKAMNTGPNPVFRKNIHNYMEIYKATKEKGERNLLGMPGDSTPASRFVRATILVDNLPVPSSRAVALYQADACLHSLCVPATKEACPTLWVSIRDLDNLVYYTKDIVSFGKKRILIPHELTEGYKVIDLKKIDFNPPQKKRPHQKISLPDPKKINIISAKEAKVLNP